MNSPPLIQSNDHKNSQKPPLLEGEELKEQEESAFKDIFRVTQDELLDLIDRNNQQYAHHSNVNNFMDELLSHGSVEINNKNDGGADE